MPAYREKLSPESEPVFVNIYGHLGIDSRNRVHTKNWFWREIDFRKHWFHVKELKISDLPSLLLCTRDFSLSVATELVWIDLCPVLHIAILILNYQNCVQNGSEIVRWANTARCALPQSREVWEMKPYTVMRHMKVWEETGVFGDCWKFKIAPEEQREINALLTMYLFM